MFTFSETENLPGMTWCLRFLAEPFADWKDKFTIHLWEGKNRISYAKTKEEERRYIQEAYEDVEMTEIEEVDEPSTEDQDEEEEEEEEEEEQAADNASDASDDDKEQSFEQGSKNQHLAVGYKNDLSYVTRGNKIGVFTHAGDKLHHRTTIDKVKNTAGKSFSPQQVCGRTGCR
jgi:hypothetical protein